MTTASDVALDFYRIATPLVLAFIGFWLVRFVGKVDALEKIMTSMQLTFAASNTKCGEMHLNINAKLKTHEKQIAELYDSRNHHELEISTLKNKIS